VTEELLTFHKAVYQMQAQEEELIDCHHQVTEVCLSLFLSLCPSVRPAVCLLVCSSVSLSVCLSILVRPSVSLSGS